MADGWYRLHEALGLKAVLSSDRMARLTPPQSIFFLKPRRWGSACPVLQLWRFHASCDFEYQERSVPAGLFPEVKPAISVAARFGGSLHLALRRRCRITQRQSAQKPTTQQPLSGRLQPNNARRGLVHRRTHRAGTRNHELPVRAKAKEHSYREFRNIWSAVLSLVHRPTPLALDVRSLRKRPAYWAAKHPKTRKSSVGRGLKKSRWWKWQPRPRSEPAF